MENISKVDLDIVNIGHVEEQNVIESVKRDVYSLYEELNSPQLMEEQELVGSTTKELLDLKAEIQNKKVEKQRKGPKLTKSAGMVQGPSGKETYYNMNMSNIVQSLRVMGIQGRYWVREDGVKMYGNYVMIAANGYPKGTIIPTTLGDGIVCDRGRMRGNHIDIAVNWGNKSKKIKK